MQRRNEFTGSSAYRDNAEKFATDFVLKLLKKRLFSSPQAFLLTLQKHRESVRRSARAHSTQPAHKFLAQVFDRAEEDFSDEEERTEAAQEALDAAARAFRPVSVAENAIRDELEGWAKKVGAVFAYPAFERTSHQAVAYLKMAI